MTISILGSSEHWPYKIKLYVFSLLFYVFNLLLITHSYLKKIKHAI